MSNIETTDCNYEFRIRELYGKYILERLIEFTYFGRIKTYHKIWTSINDKGEADADNLPFYFKTREEARNVVKKIKDRERDEGIEYL